MGKVRISSLAKELGIKSNNLIDKCHEKGLTHIKHHANTLDPEQVEMLKKLFRRTPNDSATKKELKVKEAIKVDVKEQKREDKEIVNKTILM